MIHAAHTDIPLHHYQIEQRVPTEYYSTETYVLPQQTQISTPTVTTYETHETITSHSNIPPAPPLLANFNVRPTYSEQKIMFINGGLKDMPFNTGNETIIECQFTGHPDNIQWFRNGVEIVNNPQQPNAR